jgi:hypothetical protein
MRRTERGASVGITSTFPPSRISQVGESLVATTAAFFQLGPLLVPLDFAMGLMDGLFAGLDLLMQLGVMLFDGLTATDRHRMDADDRRGLIPRFRLRCLLVDRL